MEIIFSIMTEEKLRVAYILATDRGGMLHYLSQLANAMTRYAHVTVIGPKEFSYKYFSRKIDIKNVLDSPIEWRPHRCLSFINIGKATREVNPDVIHLTMAHHPLIALSIHLLGIDRKYPIVYTNHDPRPHIDNLIWEVVGSLLYRHVVRVDKIIVHGKILKAMLIRDGVPEEKIAVIPHGDYSFFTNFMKNVSTERNCILFFGHIRDYKGLEYLIKAADIISKEIPDLKVVIAGAGDFSKYRRLIKDWSKFEVHNEFIPDEIVPQFFQRAELLVLPYVEASQSGPIHIAYAFKKPVVATSVGAIPEVVEHGKTGLLVPPRDVSALANAIIKLLKDEKLRKEMGENAYQKLRKELSWDEIAKKTLEVYREAIRCRRG